jgi:glycosyltransferase involved in cell wall biosynthesis
MKVSIITVVYNNEMTINEAIISVLSQSYSNIEYLIIDGNSSDKTVQIINNHKGKLGYFISEKDAGIYDAMNKGIKAATGDVVGILNSDDLYYDHTVIETVMSQFLLNPSLDIIYGDLVYVKSDDIDKVIRNWKSNSYYNNFFDNGNVPPHPSLFVKKSVYEEAGLFNLDFKLAADYEFMLRVFKKNNFKSKYINKVIVKMRLGGATNQSFSNIIKQNKEILLAWKNNNLKAPLLLMPLRIIKRLCQFI